MKKLIPILLFLFILNVNAQDELQLPFKFGDVTINELNLKYYDKDSSANALVIYEKALASKVEINQEYFTKTQYYYKIILFNHNGFDYATKEIWLYHTSKNEEKVEDINGITHNLVDGVDQKTFLLPSSIFKSEVSENNTQIKFTMPNIKPGSIVEFSYAILSPFDTKFTGWYFQGDIPKKYSELHASIPGNWVYNKLLIGYQKLDINKTTVKKNCFHFSNYKNNADCEDLTYAMYDVPAFKEEDYTTSKYNYLSRISFELSEIHNLDGSTKKYSETWKDVDKYFRFDSNIGKQLRKINFVKKLLPPEFDSITDTLSRAKAVYHYIQDYFTWNEEYRMFYDFDIKTAFDKHIGNNVEINIALCNALNAVGIETKLMLTSTRTNGLPTFVHPILSDFNYAIAFSKIGNIYYQLDASIKLLPFGLLPFKALNSFGRVMDFENDSYWQDLIQNRNVKNTSLNLSFKENLIKGFMRITSNAYMALKKRDAILTENETVYRKDFEYNTGQPDFVIESYRNKNLNAVDEPLIEDFKISYDFATESNDLLILNPFFDKINTNPFKLKERLYPVDLGYPITENYLINLTVPDNFTISSVPKSENVVLANDDASLISSTTVNGQIVSITYKININKTHFKADEYQQLKSFFKSIIDYQNEVIILKKKL